MANSPYSEKSKSQKLGPQQIIIAIVMVVVLFVVFQLKVIPAGIAGFVVPLFQPSGEQLTKIGFVEFEGLVWASVSKDKENLYQGRDVEIKKEYINGDFIFDFSFEERTEPKHGYVKGAQEFYAKSEVLGEHAIILEPWVGLWWLALVLAVFVTALVTMILPTSIGFMSVLFDKQIDHTKVKIRLQTGFTDTIVELLTMPDDKLREKDPMDVERYFRTVWDRTGSDESASSRQAITFDDLYDENVDLVAFRNRALYNRIQEFFSDFVLKEIEDTKSSLLWRRNHLLIFAGLRIYMAHHFTEKYANNVTGLAYGGAAFLIVAVGIRGLKFIPASKPSFILLAIFLEFTMLALLAITLIYTEEEERMDKMLKKMEDANRSQLEALRGQQHDIHLLVTALVGQASEIVRKRIEDAVTEFISNTENLESVVGEQLAEKIIISLKESMDVKARQSLRS